MKRFKMTTCVVLAVLLAITGTAAFAGTKYSNSVGLGKVLPKPTATPAPTEEPLPTEEPVVTPEPEEKPEEGYQYERDAEGNLILDENGNPITLVPDGSDAPTGFERDENGGLVLDENGNPIPTFGETEDEPVVEPTEEPVVEPTEEPVVEPTEEPTEEPVVETTPAPEATEEPVKEESEAEEVVEEAADVPTALGDADVRLEANGLSEIFITLPEGTELVVLAVEGDWIKVDVEGQIGYIYKDSVQGIVIEKPELPEGVEPEEEMKVTIFSSRRTVMAPGEIIYLTCKLEGLDDYTLTYQWQYDRGNGFEDIPGATEDTYAFEANMETLNYDWSLLVYYE